MRIKYFLFLKIFLLSLMIHGQQKTITGTVTDQSSLPLPGASVLVKGSTLGTQTDFDGNYSINAKTGDVLIFSYIGQKTVEKTIGASNTINVTLLEDAQALEEVVVTALGIERKPKELSYSVSKLDNDEVTKTKAVNVATAMVGKVSGLQINTVNNGANPNTRVVLRGNRSLLGNNEALIVVDGFPSSRGVLDRINPNDIENISVLKGANASALYGSEASNGVLVITTKKGKGKLKATYVTSYQAESVAYLPELQDQFGAGGFPDGTLYPLENVAWGPRYDGQLVDASETLDDGRVWQVPYSPIKNNHKNFFDTGSTIRHGITLSGGDETGDFLLSLDQVNTKGTVPNDTYNRTNVRLKASREFNRLKVSGNLSFFRSHANLVGNGGRQDRPVYWNVLNTPLHLPLDQLKNWRTGEFTRNEVSYYRFYENPWFIVDTQREKTDYQEFNLLTTIDYKVNDWLTISNNSGYTGGNETFKREFGAYTYAFELQSTYASMDPYGARTRDDLSNSSRFNNDLLLKFNPEFSDSFSLNAILGQNTRIQSSSTINVAGNDLIIPDFYNVSTRTGDLIGGQSSSFYRKLGVYGDLTLGFNDYLFLNLTARNDWSSTLPANNQSFFYPGAGLSFIATDALPSIKTDQGLSYLKLNFNITKTGNDPGVYATANTFFAPANFPYGSITGLSQSSRDTDPNLGPEFTRSIEAGFEIKFFRNRLNLDLTAYKTNTTDQIVPVSTSLASGASSSLINIGEIENRGLEIDLKGTILRSDNFTWDMGINYTGQDSEVISISEGVDELEIGGFSDAQVIAKVGQPYPQLRTSDYTRDDQGRVIVGANGDPIRDAQFSTQGQTAPKFIMGLNTNIRYKNWSFYAVADYRTGHVFFNDIVNALEFTGLTKHSASAGRQPFVFPNSVYSDGNGGFVPNTDRLTSGGGNAFWDAYGDVRSNYVTDATTLKIREVSFSYTFDAKVLEQLGIENLSMGLFGRNLFTFRPKDNVYTDPEFNFTTGNAIGVGTQSQTPPTRQYGINLNITF
ncbi:SusC/RagA family TonB-linked outer membrane protein [Cellulophaga tyrosinoxydans]|uniref:TonB-linked outer membrane protein, SusC/RagA family n=1 Tax=Cellulophaga tyrosinoxydans TaxID=504486 RepID=A0A1W2AN69_9FLAO|nr:SusC/RagA family TonB-linked outer membrane protein [Cellulophaga tyrosinoxydans]SMC61678.1 TonB-linked outer membrane protein, SusC/RagA family [Cellulophaga tyrosinoxydans]